MRRPLPPQHISLLAEKWLNGTISAEELEQFNNWYNQFNDEELQLPINDDYKVDDLKNRVLHQVKQRVEKEEKAPVVAMGTKWWLAAAVVSGLLLVAGYLLTFNSRAVESVVHTVNGQQTKVILPDSSIVWLKPNSSIAYGGFVGEDERRVTLTGEALFEVTKNPQQPFVIQSGNYIARVLGTSFNMRNTANQPFELTVLTGKVLVEKSLPNGKKEQQILVPLQKLTSSGVKELVLLAAAPEEKAELWAGTEYMMDFENATFTDIADRIARKFNVKCTIESDKLLHCRLTANLTGQSLTRTLELIAASINMEYQLKNGAVLLSGSGCE